MSLQPCLPLPPSRSRKRRRDRRHRGDDNASDDNASDDNAKDTSVSDEMMSGRQRIEDLSAMSAMEFIGRVHEESRRLGDVFVAAAAAAVGGGGANSGNIGDGNDGERGKTQGEDGTDDEEEEEEEEEEGEIAEPAHADAARSAAGTAGNTSTSDSTTKQPLPSNNVGISGSLAYLLSDHTHLPRPPSAAHLPASASASATSLPSASSWIGATLDDFSRLRLYLDACVEGQIGGKTQSGSGTGSTCSSSSSSSRSSRMPVPPMRAREGWHVYCLGRDEAQGYYQDDDDDEDDANMVDDKSGRRKVEAWRDGIPPAGHPPSTALLCQMDQVMVRRVLAHHVSYVCDGLDGGDGAGHDAKVATYHHRHTYAMTANRARWLYGLLARLAKPLHRDDAAMLRRLLRECCVRRAGIGIAVAADGTTTSGGGGESKAAVLVSLLNTLIAIGGIYFEQGTTEELFSLA